MDNIEVQKSGKFGHTIVARRKLYAGDLVYEEEPIFVVPPPVPTKTLSFLDAIVSASQITAAEIDAEVDKLSPQQKESFGKVSCDEDTNLSRFRSVHYDIRPIHNEAPTLFGLFEVSSYMNHSCQPNTMYRWDDNRNSLRWIALRSIAEGEELNGNYLPMYDWETLTERRAMLRRLFPFDCGCHACQLEATNASAGAARMRIRDAHRKLVDSVERRRSDNATSSTDDDDVILTDDYLDLLGQYLDVTESIDPTLYRGYFLASSVYGNNGQARKARVLRERAITILERCFEAGTKQCESERELCERLFLMSV